MAATSRPRSYSTRRSPPTSPSSVANDRREQRRSLTANVVPGSNRASILLSERQVNKINKKIANIRHNSIASSSSPQLAAKYLDPADGDAPSSPHDSSFRLSQSMTLSPAQEFATHVYPATSPSVSETPVNSATHTDPVGSFPVRIQEYAIMEDLLFVLMGIDGTYIKIVHPQNYGDDDDYSMDEADGILADRQTWDLLRFTVDSTLDPSLRHMVEKLLPLATYYMSVDSFVEQYSRYEYGSINHALSAAISTILKEYETFIAQLEHQFRSSVGFTLQQFWFYAQDTMQQMRILHDLASTIRQLRMSNEIRDDESVDIDAVLEGLKASEEGAQMRISDREKGGAILNVLTERLVSLSGDPRCKKIYSFLLAKASAPYFEILHAWIYRGEIVDPYNEFMVLEKRNVKKENLKEDFNDAYWEMRYTVREKLVPTFLEPLQAKILLAGKYLNVVRECGVNIAKPEDMQDVLLGRSIEERDQQQPETSLGLSHSRGPARNEVWSAVDGGRFVKSLEIAYKYANQTLLNLLLKEQQLIPRLRSLKHYFFLDQSDFLTSFLDLAKEELRQPAREIPLTRLQSLMDLVLRNSSSVAAYDPFKEDLKVAMSPLKLVDELLRIINVAGLDSLPGSSRADGKWNSALPDTVALLDKNQSLAGSIMGVSMTGTSPSTSALSGYDALTLDYIVTFPLSLVISRKALTKYQLLFRHLLYLKHVEDLLCANWMSHKEQLWKRRSSSPDVEAWKFRIFTLRHRMLIFVQQFAYYVTNEVLEPNWRRLESNLLKVSTVDQVLQYHSDFLDTCLKECMLTNAKLLRIYNKLMTSCVVFSGQAERFSQHIKTLEEQNTTNAFGIPKGALGEAANNVAKAHEAMDRHLNRVEESFSYHMKLLIEALNYFSATETIQFLCLVVRLDYNQFHKSSNPPSSFVARKQ